LLENENATNNETTTITAHPNTKKRKHYSTPTVRDRPTLSAQWLPPEKEITYSACRYNFSLEEIFEKSNGPQIGLIRNCMSTDEKNFSQKDKEAGMLVLVFAHSVLSPVLVLESLVVLVQRS